MKYLKNVLGVSQILKSDEALNPSAVATQENVLPQAVGASKITVWVENFNQFTTEDHTLLNNMLAAMKIPAQDMKVEDLSLKGSLQSAIEFDLVLNPVDSGSQTYSPQVMHANKNLKSAAWTFLQQVMQKYKLLS
ncbi:hypothetical protein [Pseudobdellovibrio sp. HCB154]|uniref:hypothetical protein n=1 Tax=Pseudobdellovibrio sp. HCB154 TaxID=3386277 RepID=UPI0039172670